MEVDTEKYKTLLKTYLFDEFKHFLQRLCEQ